MRFCDLAFMEVCVGEKAPEESITQVSEVASLVPSMVFMGGFFASRKRFFFVRSDARCEAGGEIFFVGIFARIRMRAKIPAFS